MGLPEFRNLKRVTIESRRLGDIKQFFVQLLPYKDIASPVSHDVTAENVYSRLELSRKYRLASNLSDKAKDNNINIVNAALELGDSVPILITIGTSKWYDGSNYEENVAGLSELLMFEQLRHLDTRVKSVYTPGLRVGLLCEDITNKWLYGLQNDRDLVDNNNKRYIDSLGIFTHHFNQNQNVNVSIIKETDLLSILKMNEGDYFDLCETNQKCFYEFIKKSKLNELEFLAGQREWNDLLWARYTREILPTIEEYINLEKLGWSGGIHPRVRDYYTRQFLKSTGKPMTDEDWYLAGYFAGVLARRQLNFLYLALGENAIKIAFLRYPEGALKEKQNALQISQHPVEGFGSSHQHISPWASVTGINIGREDGKISLTVIPAKSDERNKNIDTTELGYAGITVPVPIFER